MHGNCYAFFGRVKPLLVRAGNDYQISKGMHVAISVYKEMFLQITRDYSSLPDVRGLKISEIVFFYEGLRAELKETTKPRN